MGKTDSVLNIGPKKYSKDMSLTFIAFNNENPRFLPLNLKIGKPSQKMDCRDIVIMVPDCLLPIFNNSLCG